MRAVLVLIATLCFVLSPFVTEGFAGFRAEQFPIPQYDPPVQPAGYAFSIWGVIYVWLVISAVIGFWRHRTAGEWAQARFWIIASLLPGAFWIKLATISVLWASGLIAWMLLCALMAVYLARDLRPGWVLALPLGLYAGWLSAATLVSLGLIAGGYWGYDPAGVAVLCIIAALGIGVINQLRLRAVWSYGLALSWGLVGIGMQNFGTNLYVATLAAIAAIVMLVFTFRQKIQRGFS